MTRKLIFCFMSTLFLVLASAGGALANPLVFIDAAHGGTDSGSVAGKQVEKDWTLRFALALKQAFTEAGIDVVLSRQDDSTVDSDSRAQLINTSGAALALVIHVDRENSGTVQGPYLVVEPPNHPDLTAAVGIRPWGIVTPAQYRASLRLARALAAQLGLNPHFSDLSDSRGLFGERGTADGRIFCAPEQSLRNLTLPAVALVPLFMTNAEDVKKFSRPTGMDSFCAQVVKAVGGYLRVSGE